MNRYRDRHLAALLVVWSLSAVAAHAAERARQAPAMAASEVRALTPAQLTAIRGVSRNVLAAKKSGGEDAADADQLARLRASLDALIAADPGNRSPITLQGQESGAQRRHRAKVAGLRESARADARALAAQLRSQPEQDTRSAGLPIGAQRARLFERWAHQLDAALAEGNAERIGQLRELREQLRATRGALSDAPLSRGTPTLQAMPAGYVPPNDAAGEQGR